jgi:ubiquinone/menaquinone biosynthesis C-methylase UbiE
MVYGVDYAAGSVGAARAENRDAIRQGRVDIQRASVSQLPFPDAKFDLASAVETMYYWPEPIKDLQEIVRVLKPGGRLIVINETYKGGRWNFLKGPAMKLIRARNFSTDDYRQLMTSAGFTEIQIVVEPARGWICAVGRRPS